MRFCLNQRFFWGEPLDGAPVVVREGFGVRGVEAVRERFEEIEALGDPQA